jgi:hypothetical protein
MGLAGPETLAAAAKMSPSLFAQPPVRPGDPVARPSA